jgi:hypothetical protein
MNTPALVLALIVAGCGDRPDVIDDVPDVERTTIDEEVPDPGTIAIVVRDFQFFHPFSRSRALMNPSGASKPETVRSRDSFGVGLVIDAVNESPHLLTQPDLLGQFELVGAHGSKTCELTPKRYGRGRGPNHLSLDPRSKGKWLDETKQNYERAWRPGETIRLAARKDCGSFYLLDTALETVRLKFQVTAEAMLHARRSEATFPLPDPDAPIVVSEEQTISLPADAAILQRTTFQGNTGHVAGDVVMTWTDGKFQRVDLGRFGIRADALERTPVPDQYMPVTVTEGELALTVDGVSLQHWSEEPAIGKGLRQVDAQVSIAVDSAAIEARIGAGPDATPAAAAAAARAVGLERARFNRMVSCHRIVLVTTARAISAANGAAAATACAVLSGEDTVQFQLRYSLGRYEVPVGLIVPVGKKTRFVPVDHQALLRFDPR